MLKKIRTNQFSHQSNVIRLSISVFIACSVFIISSAVFAQSYHAHNWVFGRKCRVSWSTTGIRTVGTVPNIDQHEGVASYSDPVTGKLVIYTDGVTAWNSYGVKVSKGSLGGGRSSKNSGVIVSVPGHASRIYVIANGDSIAPIYYTIFDLLGNVKQVSVSRKKVVASDGSSEVMQITAHSSEFNKI